MTTKAERIQMKKQHFQELMEFDAEYRRSAEYIAGVDEVGRGPLAGPVVSAAVVLPEDFDVFEINDSKKLSDKKRRELDQEIRRQALAYGFGMRDNRRIDEVNILNATKEAMGDAVRAAAAMLRRRIRGGTEEPRPVNLQMPVLSSGQNTEDPMLIAAQEAAEDAEKEAAGFSPVGMVLIDAVHLEELEEAGIPQDSPVKGDFRSASVAAASIIAKVRRDDMMIAFSREYPGYAFEKNKGYGTREHYEGLRAHGLTPIHRRTFLKNFL